MTPRGRRPYLSINLRIWHEETARIQSADHPACSELLYRSCYPGCLYKKVQHFIYTQVSSSHCLVSGLCWSLWDLSFLQWSCCMFMPSGMWCPDGSSAWCNTPKVLNLYQTFCHEREVPVRNIQDCWIVLNDTYIGSFSVILFSVKNAHCFGSWLCLRYQVKPKVSKPTAQGPLHWAKHHPFTSCMAINLFFSVESIVPTH